jgi:hypothetical protein
MLRRDARASVGHLDIAMGAVGAGPHPDIAARCPTAFPIRLASIRSTRRGSVVSVSGSPPAATRSAKPRAAISAVTRNQTSHQGLSRCADRQTNIARRRRRSEERQMST